MKPRRPVRRVYDLNERRPIVATFQPDGVVVFREKGRRKTYSAHLRTLFIHAVRIESALERERKKQERAARRAARG
jgi:hypothetical protein